jgi:hypothetical protein
MGAVARELRCSRTGLYRLPNFMKLVNADRGQAETRRRRLPRGNKDKVSGEFDAWSAGRNNEDDD